MPALLLVCSHKVEGAAQIVPSISTFATTFITGDVLYTSRTELLLRASRLRYSYFFVPANILSTYSGFIDNRIAFKIKSSSFYIQSLFFLEKIQSSMFDLVKPFEVLFLFQLFSEPDQLMTQLRFLETYFLLSALIQDAW